MSPLGPGKLRRVATRMARRVRGWLSPGAMILLYHRVAELETDPQCLAVSPRHFGEQMQVLGETASPISLRGLLEGVSSGGPPGNAVVVTLDDGYADALHEAKPVLERRGVPTTVFVAAGSVGQRREFYWDELDRLLLQPVTLPGTLEVEVGGELRRWQLPSVAEHDPAREEHRGWSVRDRDDPTPRQRTYRELSSLLRTLDESDRLSVLGRLRVWAGARENDRPTHRPLSEGELVELSQGGLVDIGAHTVTHPVLATLAEDRQREEIRDGKSRLEEIVGRPVVHFAYPYGTRADYTNRTVALVREAGFACACANFPGVVRAGANVYELPRLAVRDWDGDEFARRMREWRAS